MDKELFYCKSKRIADYLTKHGSRLVKTEKRDGSMIYVFEKDDSVFENLDNLDIDMRRCLF